MTISLNNQSAVQRVVRPHGQVREIERDADKTHKLDAPDGLLSRPLGVPVEGLHPAVVSGVVVVGAAYHVDTPGALRVLVQKALGRVLLFVGACKGGGAVRHRLARTLIRCQKTNTGRQQYANMDDTNRLLAELRDQMSDLDAKIENVAERLGMLKERRTNVSADIEYHEILLNDLRVERTTVVNRVNDILRSTGV